MVVMPKVRAAMLHGLLAATVGNMHRVCNYRQVYNRQLQNCHALSLTPLRLVMQLIDMFQSQHSCTVSLLMVYHWV